ncbi:MAG TPA: M1 family aminopeptidase [Candidatus Syntrophosphaera thermopropionivorans]|nr:M1 family aminopeptidase [Candidatus Syntrophosphaera thermopropionivorans]
MKKNRKITRFLILLSLLMIGSMLYGNITKPYSVNHIWSESDKADSLTGFDVQMYELTLSINEQTHYINGNVLATVLAEENLSYIEYNLVGLTVNSVLVNNIPAAYTHSNGIIHINLNISAGSTFTTQVFYSGIPQLSSDIYHIGMIFTANSVFTISDPDAARYWWPCYDHPWDKAIINLTITIRSDWKVAANGLRTNIVDNGDGTSTTYWIGQYPMTTYLVCVTCGPYVEFDQSMEELPIINFVLPGQYNNALITLSRVPMMIDYFSQLFGPYPFEKYGHAVVNMSTYGAMEHQTMTTLGNYIINGTLAYETTIAHELAHQWYGDAVSFLTFKDVWLSEGFATYSEHLWKDKTEGWESACNYIRTEFHNYYINWENTEGPHTIYNPNFNSYFAPPSYEKAASVLHMLRLKIGDANFFSLLQNWYNTYCYGNAITSEFQAMAEQISGQDLDQFFQQWIYSPGIPSVEYSVWFNNESNSPLKIVAKTISNTSTPFYLEVPFRLTQAGISDSLFVQASPEGFNNYFNITLGAGSVFNPNYHNWTLLRSITEKRPVLVECLPTNNSVFLSWESFPGSPDLGYRIYRRNVDNGSEWIALNSEPLYSLSFIDNTAINGTLYQYAISAIDSEGWSSLQSNIMSAVPVLFSFAQDFLVVDETRDGNGSNISPDDAMVDNFYNTALIPIEYDSWDVASEGLPDLATLGGYKVVLWHADDLAENLLVEHQSILGSYILGGGKVLISGWKTAIVLTETFLQRFAGIPQVVYDNVPCLISAQSSIYPELWVDSNKLIPAWNGMLPYICTFPEAEQIIYIANMNPAIPHNGNCLALRHSCNNGELILLGFPLYYMQAEGVRDFLQLIIPELINTPVIDSTIPSVVASMKIYPNPFHKDCHIQISLADKGLASLSLYNLKGQKVKTFFQEAKMKGDYTFNFDGKDDNGKVLPSGIYILRLKQSDRIITRRISYIK